jgi:hypothetical protein
MQHARPWAQQEGTDSGQKYPGGDGHQSPGKAARGLLDPSDREWTGESPDISQRVDQGNGAGRGRAAEKA